MLKIYGRTQLQKICFLVLIPLFISACGSQQTDQTITDTTWQWREMAETEPASQSLVPNPENFTIRFSADGNVNIQADCNMVQGSYTLDGSALTIELGPTTLAFCGEDSLDQLYLAFLSNVAGYTVENGQLVLDLKDEAGRMTFNEG